jgi:hypothetical protein
MTIDVLRRCAAVLEVTLDIVPRWRGADLAHLMDEDHATLQAAWADRLRRWGWEVRVEVSFSQYGDRGRVDLLCWHPVHRVLLIGEVKGELVDVQALLGGLDVKVRVGPRLGRNAGWPAPALTAPLLIVRHRTTARARIARLAPLFANYVHRGRAAVGCLRHPERLVGGLLILSDLPIAAEGRAKRLGSHRVRVRRASSGVASVAAPRPAAPRPALRD